MGNNIYYIVTKIENAFKIMKCKVRNFYVK